MTGFLIQTSGVKPLLAVIASHGLTDLDTTTWVPTYGLLILLPLPSPVVTGLFCGSSVLHFAEDLGAMGSMLLHTGVAVVGWHMGMQAAFKTMIGYLSFCHVPMHFWRCYCRGRHKSAFATASVTLVATMFSHTMREWAPLTDTMQRIVVAHIVTEMGIATAALCKSQSQ